MIVTVDEVKTHLRIQYDEEDAYLTSLIAQAQAAAEDYCRTQFSDPAPEPVRLAVLLMVGFYLSLIHISCAALPMKSCAATPAIRR